MLTYTIVLTPDAASNALSVTVPAMPGVQTWGADLEEALASAREAIELHLESYVERGRPFPPDRRLEEGRMLTIDVRPPAGATRNTA